MQVGFFFLTLFSGSIKSLEMIKVRSSKGFDVSKRDNKMLWPEIGWENDLIIDYRQREKPRIFTQVRLPLPYWIRYCEGLEVSI